MLCLYPFFRWAGAAVCESEEPSVGGVDSIDVSLFEGFDYVALGHLHSPQKVGRDTVRYAGSPLKYSFSEAHQHKAALFVTLGEKGSVRFEAAPLTPRHDLRELRGNYMELTDRRAYDGMNLGVDFTAADFKTGLATGLRYFTTHEGPYLVHCTEGKDRAGFVSALLECYMGAAYDEVVADYMVTYYNYYGVTKEAEPAKYDAILRSNIVKTLQTAFGVEDLKTADLKQEATDFFKELGLTDAELTTLTANLSKEYTGGSTEPETKSYVKVTAAPEDWSGTYLIVNEADETSAYVFNGNDAVNGYVSATIANSKITSSTELDAVAVTIEKTTDGYTLKVNGQYIYGTDGKNTLKFTDTAANAVNTITLRSRSCRRWAHDLCTGRKSELRQNDAF